MAKFNHGPIVAVGASAGGLQALKELFSRLPAECAAAFVVIQHLDPAQPSMLSRVLNEVTELSVVEATSGMALEPGSVHVAPSHSDLTVQNGILRLVARQRTGRLHLPIDSFFRALAEDSQGRAIGVVLSGSGADGTEGLRAIKSQGGIAMAQEPKLAQFGSMPESAIAAGVVDFRGSPEHLAEELVRLSRHPYVTAPAHARQGQSSDEGSYQDTCLAAIFSALRHHAGMDFSGYKRTTVLRRIERRMALRRADALEDYAKLLEHDSSEANALAQDMLIHVTSFFRDPAAFEALKEQVFSQLIHRKQENGSLRIWVPGCATGEEAYGLVMCLLESLDSTTKHLSVQLFGSDVSAKAIEIARLGVYPESTLTDVPSDRLDRFFDRAEGGYRINRSVRDLCVFIKHDLTQDPPFAKLDLISCRNLLIYFDTELQRRVIPMLHYCLNPESYLFLGQSETVSGFFDLFSPVDKIHRIFMKTGDSLRLARFPLAKDASRKEVGAPSMGPRPRLQEAQREADHLLLSRYAPPGVIVNDQLEIIQFRGRTGAFLEPAPGQPQANVLRMARGSLAAHLHDGVNRAKAENATVRKHGLAVEFGHDTHLLDLEIVPLTAAAKSGDRYFLILFEEVDKLHAKVPDSAQELSRPPPQRPEAAPPEMERLKVELLATKDYLQALVSEHQSTTDELAATNEELIAANEELQSTNEELQSAKEELQSTNEELSTVNDQLRHRNLELDQTASDLVNVLASVEIPVIIVDLELRVRRFTPIARDIVSFIPEDVGRPIEDLNLKVHVEDLTGRIRQVLDALKPAEWEVQGQDGRWFRLQIRPYRTSDNRLDGAILSFVDVDALRRAIEDAESARDYARSIVETVSTALVVLDAGLHVVSANEAFYNMFALTAQTAEGKLLTECNGGLWEAPAPAQALDEALGLRKSFSGIEIKAELPRRGTRSLSLSGRPILWGGDAKMVLVSVEDVTDLRFLEAERALLLESEKQARLEAEGATRAKDLFLATLSHELRTPLSTMVMSAQLLKKIAADDPRIQRPSASIARAANAQSKLIDDLLDVSRIVSGKLMLDLGPVDFAAVVQEAVDLTRPDAQAKSLELDLSIGPEIGTLYGDAVRLQQIVNNLLTNAIKFTPHGGHISVAVERIDHRAQLTVTDSGMGIPESVLPRLFARFVQADSTVTRTHGGLGLGLSIVRHLVEAHGGEVHAESLGERQGATFRVTLPTSDAIPPPSNAEKSIAYSIEGVHVLLVEDDDDTREAYAMMLKELGAIVLAVPSAAAGLDALREFQPRVILSDIAMPGEDGLSFLRKVRQLPAARGGRTPAAAVTALASDEDRKQSIQAGFQIHVAKPIDAVQLAAVVSRLANTESAEAPA